MKWNTASVGIALLLALPSGAQAGVVVLHGPDVDAAQASILAKDQLGTGDLRVAGPLSEWIGVEGGAPVVVGLTTRTCIEPKQDPRGLAGSLLPLREQMMEMSYSSAILRAMLLVDRLPCLARDAQPDDLYELLFTRGIAHFFDGEEAEARSAFAAAAAIDPSREWPRKFPPSPKDTYLDALREVVSEPPALLRSELPGQLFLDGAPVDDTPRLHKGGHLIYDAESDTALWVDVASPAALPPDGLLVTTADLLRDGLITGDVRYLPWLARLAEEEGWTEVALVSASWTILYKDGVLQTLKADQRALRRAAADLKRSKGPRPLTGVGVVLAGSGLALAGIGSGLNLDAYQRGIPQVGEPLLPQAEYEPLNTQNQAGLGMAVAGGATAITGVVVALVGLALPPTTVALAPWIVSDGATVAFGIGGSLP